jgi:transposase-like protein
MRTRRESRVGEKRRRYSVEQKATIMRRHLLDKVPVSDLCDEYKIQPSVVYGWLRQALGNLELAIDTGRRKKRDCREAKLTRENEALKAKLAKKDRVIAEISEEYIDLKKELGEL